MTLLQALSLCIFLNLGYLSKYFTQIYRAQYGAPCWYISMVPQHGSGGTPRTLALQVTDYGTEQTSIYILSTFSNTLTSEQAKNHEIIR